MENEGDDTRTLGSGTENIQQDAFQVDQTPVEMLEEITILKIFEKLSDADVTTCFRACPQWRQWLMDKSTRFLFPEVAPLILKELPKDKLLKYRLVCKPWREALDNAYQSHPQHLQVHSHHGKSKENLPELVNYFESANKIKTFLHEMESHSGNPFLGRHVRFGLDTSLYEGDANRRNKLAFCKEFWNVVVQLLDAFGPHIHFISFNFDTLGFVSYRELVDLDAVNILRRCLERIPNVKKLKVQEDDTFDSTPQVHGRIRTMHLTKLLELESVELVGTPITLTKSILEKCCVSRKIKQVFILSMFKWTGLTNSVYRFPNLEVLDTIITSKDFVIFRKLKRRPPLRKLVITFRGDDKTVQRIFKHLEIFKETLEKVDLYGTNMNEGSIGFRVNLPKLESLSIECYEGNLDPFINLPSLKNLNLAFSGGRLLGQNVVDLYGFEQKMEISNIWTLIPSLQTLQIKGTIMRPKKICFDIKYRRTDQGIIHENFDDDEQEARENRSRLDEMGALAYVIAHVMKNIP